MLLVGNDNASKLYVSLKEKTAKEIGIDFSLFKYGENVAQAEILQQIEKLNLDENVHGIIVQLPLPQGFDTQKIIESIDPKKDADGFHPENTKLFLDGNDGVSPVFPRAIRCLIESSGEELAGKKAVVVANSDEFGKIMCAILLQIGVVGEYVLSGNILSNLDDIKGADVVVSAVGTPGLLNVQMLKEGAIVIDGGIEKVGDRVLGDVDFASLAAFNGHITPVPGGVGPVTIACLLENVYLSFEAQQREK